MQTWVIKLFVGLVVAAALLLTLPNGSAQAKSLEDYDWIEVETEHFRLRSIRGKRATLKYARELTLFINVMPEEIRQLTRAGSGFVTIYLLRFLMDNKESWEDLANRLRNYIQLVGNDADYQSAFEEAFDMTMQELAAGISEHGQRCCTRYKVDLEVIEKGFDPEVRKLDRDTIKEALEEISERRRALQPDE
jgi:hypothetical protein